MYLRYLLPLVRRLVSPETLTLVTCSSKQNFNIFAPIMIYTKIRHPKLMPFIHFRCYAKSKDKKKEKNPAKVEINETRLREVINLDSFTGQLQNTIERMKDDFTKQLSLRSTTGAVDGLNVHVNGKDHELRELAQISRKNPKIIVINLKAFPQTIPDVLRAIDKSGMNLNPQQDGTTLFIPIPKVTRDHRESLSKNAKVIYIRYRDIIKDIQNDTIKKLKKTEISKDDLYFIQNQIIAIATKYVTEAEKILAAKNIELLGRE